MPARAVNLDVRIIWKKGFQLRKMPPSNWPVGNWSVFLINDCYGRAQNTGVGWVLGSWVQSHILIPGTQAWVDAWPLLLSPALKGLGLGCHCGRLLAHARDPDDSCFLHGTPGRLDFNHTNSVRLPVLVRPPPARFPGPSLSPGPIRPPAPPPHPLGPGMGGR